MNESKVFDIAFDKDEQVFVYCIYDQYGNISPYHILKERAAVQLARYNDIISDLSTAKDAINQLILLKEADINFTANITMKALYELAINSYIKCFNSTDGRKTKLDYKVIFKDNNDLRVLYEKVLEIRNNRIAHSGQYSNGLTLYLDYKTKYPIDLKFLNLKSIPGNDTIENKKIADLINYTLIKVKEIQIKLNQKLIDEMKVNGYKFYSKSIKHVDKSTIIRMVLIDDYLVAEEAYNRGV